MEKKNLGNMTLPQLTEFVVDLGLPVFRARQIFSWLYRPNITSFDQMTDIKRELRVQLAQQACFTRLEPGVVERSRDGTVKFGFRLEDDYIIESVLIPEEDRHTLCISSQVGCAMACDFCLTATLGFKRNLRVAEIVGQVYSVKEYMLEREMGDITNLVFMGMGEPLANFDNLIFSLSILQEQQGLDFSDRRITVSTCGFVPNLKKLGQRSRVNLAVSLHSVDDRIRSRLMPINNKYPVDMLLKACREYPLPKRKRIMFEYVLIKGLNDSPRDAIEVAEKLKGIRCKINLLPYNESAALPYRRPSDAAIEEFREILRQAGYTTLIRNSRGADISAACGQLAGQKTAKKL